MLRHTKLNSLAALLVLLACFAAGSAHAACTSPAGNEADAIYNHDYHTYQFCNGSNWIAYGGAGGGGALTLISTQTASASASLQWTGLPTSYNTFLLGCNGIQPATNNVTFELQFGEGGTPTWETANYGSEGSGADSAGYGSNSNNGTSLSAIYLDNGHVVNTATADYSTEVWIHNLSTVGIYKSVFSQTANHDAVSINSAVAASNYTGDTNAITAIRVLFSSGNIAAGQCSLYGINN